MGWGETMKMNPEHLAPFSSSGLSILIGVWVPLLHHGEVEVLVGKEASTDHHRETDSQDSSHQTKIFS